MSVKRAEVRLITIGDSATGKSSLILRYTKGSFTEERKATVGIDMRIRTVEIEGRKVKVKIWDTAGQEQFRVITRNYYRGAQGVVLVYDITNRPSFQHVTKWIRDVKEYADEGVNVVLVGNKCDLETDRQVSKAEGREIAEKNQLAFFETSALSGIYVEDAFGELVTSAVAKLPPEEKTVNISSEEKNKSCCK
ncbi:hypothetical protein AAMO2058_001177500 [Amorphochlora amoebiformis]|uniref:Uncharacterized protein n=1 Tax=Amorphochlora amoebiformis TaxID=1561963 RepID=A0A6T6SQD1_9EUKA|mmetsp:Transcript_15479/g.24514  ORF Transcript_15479/g.24514 Transcript_15479/m.24514 type:complete len:193 (+) Transcript_15479:55-633(+)